MHNPGVRLALVLSALWLASWLLAWIPAARDATGPLGLPLLTWAHIALGVVAVGSVAWAVDALSRWEDREIHGSQHPSHEGHKRKSPSQEDAPSRR
jgi:hypothetical protein